ncbi:MAG TPA: phospho-sugar mutase, partial [Spirochaetia bacterium]|nr:phospho-sugar mutase [Spirochaetia bacterium]
RLNEIYQELGYFQEETISHYFPGQEGKATMERLMNLLRDQPPETLGGSAVVEVRDFQSLSARRVSDSTIRRIEGITSSNVLQFVLEGNSTVSCRPSGTEPKIKFYASVAGVPTRDLAKARADVDARVKRLSGEIKSIIATVG